MQLTVIVTSAKLEQEQYAAVLRENTPAPYLLLDVNSNAEKASVAVIYTLHEDTATGKTATPVTSTLSENTVTGKTAIPVTFTSLRTQSQVKQPPLLPSPH